MCTATSIGSSTSRPSPSIIVSAIWTMVSNARGEKKRGLKRARTAERRSSVRPTQASASAPPATIGSVRPAMLPHTSQASAATSAKACPTSSAARFWRRPAPASASRRPAADVPAARHAAAEGGIRQQRVRPDRRGDAERRHQQAEAREHVGEHRLLHGRPVAPHRVRHETSFPAADARASVGEHRAQRGRVLPRVPRRAVAAPVQVDAAPAEQALPHDCVHRRVDVHLLPHDPVERERVRARQDRVRQLRGAAVAAGPGVDDGELHRRRLERGAANLWDRAARVERPQDGEHRAGVEPARMRAVVAGQDAHVRAAPRPVHAPMPHGAAEVDVDHVRARTVDDGDEAGTRRPDHFQKSVQHDAIDVGGGEHTHGPAIESDRRERCENKRTLESLLGVRSRPNRHDRVVGIDHRGWHRPTLGPLVSHSQFGLTVSARPRSRTFGGAPCGVSTASRSRYVVLRERAARGLVGRVHDGVPVAGTPEPGDVAVLVQYDRLEVVPRPGTCVQPTSLKPSKFLRPAALPGPWPSTSHGSCRSA